MPNERPDARERAIAFLHEHVIGFSVNKTLHGGLLYDLAVRAFRAEEQLKPKCPACNSVGMSHCSDPLNCGGVYWPDHEYRKIKDELKRAKEQLESPHDVHCNYQQGPVGTPGCSCWQPRALRAEKQLTEAITAHHDRVVGLSQIMGDLKRSNDSKTTEINLLRTTLAGMAASYSETLQKENEHENTVQEVSAASTGDHSTARGKENNECDIQPADEG